jgi:putative membrane protein
MAANRATSNVAARARLAPRESEASRAVTNAAERSLAALRRLSGTDFDAAYLAHEVAFHQEVIALLDDILIPSARHAELAGLLRKVRPNFDTHLAHARHAHAALRSGGR